MAKKKKMGSAMLESPAHSQGNHLILTKVDKLRELVGARVALPQLVVVGDQSSGKSSVLEGLTGFAFPRAAELCTRYATQITCRREAEESITVSIIPYTDAHPHEQERVRRFSRSLSKITTESLADLFRDANEAMGIRTASRATSADGHPLPAFSEHILRIEKLGPSEEHFTVIDVPGIFRQETEGLTEESDIELVMNMVKNYMRDTRTIILAIMPCNTDPATQEILKLAKKADPTMTRTMAVLTKPDLAIEKTYQQIAIDHVLGKRSDLTLGYYVVKNRGSDHVDMTLQQGLAEERNFFSKAPWSILSHTGRAGMDNLKVRVRDLLIDLIKREFPKLRTDVTREVQVLRSSLDKMGPSRSNEHTQRAYLNKISEAFQTLSRYALDSNYTGDRLFAHRYDLRLITRVVEASEKFNESVEKDGHTWAFAADPGQKSSWAADSPPLKSDSRIPKQNSPGTLRNFLDLTTTKKLLAQLKSPHPVVGDTMVEYPELEDLLDFDADVVDVMDSDSQDIMEYIEEVYRSSRGQDLGTFGGTLLSTMLKEQSAKWEPITMAYLGHVVLTVHHFIIEVIKEICPDPKVLDQLWDSFLLEELQKSYERALNHARFLLTIEREGTPLTLNHYFSDNLQKAQTDRMVQLMQELGGSANPNGNANGDDHHQTNGVGPNDTTEEGEHHPQAPNGVFLTMAQLRSLPQNKANAQYVREYMHDVLKSYYKVARKSFVDMVWKQAVNHYLLRGPGSPLHIFTTDMVLSLNADQLDMIAAEDAPVKDLRDKLSRDIENFQEALKVLKGSSS